MPDFQRHIVRSVGRRCSAAVTRHIRLGAVLAALMLGVAHAAVAHHSRVMYDYSKKIELTGIVKDFQYSSPHTWLLIDVTEKNGTVSGWAIEGGGPTSMRQIGVRKRSLPIGESVKVVAHPHRNGQKRALWIEVTRLSNGNRFAMGNIL